MSFWIALQFLTRLPAPKDLAYTPESLGRSVLYYPLVGFAIGACLFVVAFATQAMATGISAALILACWVAITGALHLDGLADTVDAWVGGHGDRTKTFAIMKDPSCGPMAVVALALVLLLKYAALTVVVEQKLWSVLFIAPVFSRASIVALLNWTPAARADGLLAALLERLPRSSISWVLSFTLLYGFLTTGLLQCAWVVIVGGLVYLFCRASMMKRLNGATGDTAGATLELVELAVLIALVT